MVPASFQRNVILLVHERAATFSNVTPPRPPSKSISPVAARTARRTSASAYPADELKIGDPTPPIPPTAHHISHENRAVATLCVPHIPRRGKFSRSDEVDLFRRSCRPEGGRGAAARRVGGFFVAAGPTGAEGARC